MSDMNSVCLIGRMVRDVEVRYTQNNVAHSIFSVAVERSIKRNDKWEKETSFIDVEAWGNLAESARKNSGKGKRIGVNGFLLQKKWTDKNGVNKSKICIVASSLQIVDFIQQQNQQQQYNQEQNYGDFEEDIPF